MVFDNRPTFHTPDGVYALDPAAHHRWQRTPKYIEILDHASSSISINDMLGGRAMKKSAKRARR
jgi:hypothetical protein